MISGEVDSIKCVHNESYYDLWGHSVSIFFARTSDFEIDDPKSNKLMLHIMFGNILLLQTMLMLRKAGPRTCPSNQFRLL